MTANASAKNPAEQLQAARALCREGKFGEGIELLKQVIAADPSNASAHNFLGMALDRTGKPNEALPCFDRAIATDPNFADALANKADTLSSLGRYQEAIRFYDRAVGADAENSLTWCNRGIALMEMASPGRSSHAPATDALLRDALASGERALRLEPSLTEAQFLSARIHVIQKRPAQAIDAIAPALDQNHPHARQIFVEAALRLEQFADSKSLRENLTRAMDEAWLNPRDLFPVCASLVRQGKNPLGELVRSAAGKSPDDIIAHPGFEAMLTDRLLLSMLKSVFVFDERLEIFLTAVRRALLEVASPDKDSAGIADRALDLACALAEQCFINEYVFDVSQDETQQIEALRGTLSASLEAGSPPHAFSLAVFACYRPLNELPNTERLKRTAAPKSFQELVRQQILEAEELQELRASILPLTGIEDSVSLAVKNQYEENPYPRWTRTKPPARPQDINECLQARFSSVRVAPIGSKPDVLIAGCGTGIQIADHLHYKDAKILAVDLSLQSLSYAKMKMRSLGFGQVEFAQADIMNLGAIRQRFDLIVSTGVLHHLKDPEAGWRNLVSLLEPNGVMLIALYSEQARTQIVAARKLVQENGYTSSPEDIRRFRQCVRTLDPGDPLRKVTRWTDFYSLSECRDLIFHVQEHRFSIPRIETFLRDNRLRFLGFDVRESVERTYRAFSPSDTAMTDLTAWNRFEQKNPDTFDEMYLFWAQKA